MNIHVTFILADGTQRTLAGETGYSVMEIAREAGIEAIEGACGGSCACATCHVVVDPAWFARTLPEGGIGLEEDDMLELAFYRAPTSRLGCQIVMTEALDGLVVGLPGTALLR
ncbi:MAG: 2Fe-2S iron-sulfur cluster binding domain-containing protein [Rhodospirillales bacterium]|nr:2Fe-2S iron-sulfur cluster binding domain-containing protein [Alphaproteobacteria bacterium]MCB9986338.1 2Fe-2S iron-sulfur cluster binding domain-containing protein [Rhodospirillales bacterium]USO07112.1 MAG: 2Fe-2S iron-sulfur cluster binding domain-containing protein [Rhodospirillales bacterium]